MLDSLTYTAQLQEVGFSKDQAETQMRIGSEIMKAYLATHQDMIDLKVLLKTDMDQFKLYVEQGFKDLRKDFAHHKAEIQKDFSHHKMDIQKDLLRLRADIQKDSDQLRADIQKDSDQLRADIQKDSTQLRSDIQKDSYQLKADISKNLVILKQDLTIRLGMIISVALGVAVSLSKLIG